MAAALEGECSCGAVRYRLHYTRSKVPWLTLPEGVPAVEVYYDRHELWPAASLARLDAIFSSSGRSGTR